MKGVLRDHPSLDARGIAERAIELRDARADDVDR
jgi:hypothetical protein